jgi:hypothetical protein
VLARHDYLPFGEDTAPLTGDVCALGTHHAMALGR